MRRGSCIDAFGELSQHCRIRPFPADPVSSAVTSQSNPQPSQRWRLIAAGILVLAVLTALLTLPLDQWLDQAGEWNKAHPVAGAILYLLAAIVGAVLFLPGSVIAMSAGYVYGLPLGSALALAGISAGAFAAFLNGRLLVRGWVFSLLESHPRLQALDRAVYDKSFVIVLLTRLSLIIPFNLLNYVYGVTGVRKVPYAVATVVGMIPATVLWTYIGTLARNFEEIRSGQLDAGLPGEWIVGIGLTLILVAVAIIHRTASRALRTHLGE